MLHTVDVGTLSLHDYRGVVPEEVLDPLAALARDMRGARVLHLNATPYGGGVSELLRSAIPLYNDLGITATWKIISGDDRFFATTKKLHNALQGGLDTLDPAEQAVYHETNRRNAEQLLTDPEFGSYDFVVVHDPQPVGMLSYLDPGSASWVWRCHIDTSEPNPAAWDFISKLVAFYSATVFTAEQFVPPELPSEVVDIIPPAIDPLSPKNMPLSADTCKSVLNWIGIEPHRPLVTQISRFDPWKDPLGVVEAFRLARPEIPGLQLALVGSMALDDPEAWSMYRAIVGATQSDPDIHLFTNLTGVGNVEVNAFQRLSTVVVQKSIREGFGLVVSEALWKQTPVVAGDAGGIPLQMADGAGGMLVGSVPDCAKAIVELYADRAQALTLAGAGRERVRRHFLLPRLLLDELTLLSGLAAGERPGALMTWSRHHDPVCGMTTFAADPSLSIDGEGGRTVRFCSRRCLETFRRSSQQPAAR